MIKTKKNKTTLLRVISFNVISFMLFSLLLCSGCMQQNYFRNRGKDYLTAEPCPRLSVPKEIPHQSFSDQYDIP